MSFTFSLSFPAFPAFRYQTFVRIPLVHLQIISPTSATTPGSMMMAGSMDTAVLDIFVLDIFCPTGAVEQPQSMMDAIARMMVRVVVMLNKLANNL
jgi:hypothetical protein